MTRLSIVLIELQRLGDPLLLHEHGATDGERLLPLGKRAQLDNPDVRHVPMGS